MSLTSDVLPCFISQPFFIFNRSSVGKSTLSSELGEYRKDKSNPQPSGSPRIYNHSGFGYFINK